MQAFDTAAVTYDRDFTDSSIGRIQRNRVWAYMNRKLLGTSEKRILELNCGTGEDAIYFARKGHRVLGTDISGSMIRIAEDKARAAGVGNRVEFMELDIRNLDHELEGKQFDLVFSNFGGLNCLPRNDLNDLSGKLHSLLKPAGSFISVIMGKMCLWESLYYLFHFDRDKIFRRNTEDSLMVQVNGQPVETWYYDPAGFYTFFSDRFNHKKNCPVGFFIPPSYMEPSMKKHPSFLALLETLEKATSRVGMLAYFSDHYLIDLERKKS